jgi:hypothetical protein
MEEEWEADKGRTRRVMKQTNDRRSVRGGGDAARGPGARLGAHLELWLQRRGRAPTSSWLTLALRSAQCWGKGAKLRPLAPTTQSARSVKAGPNAGSIQKHAEFAASLAAHTDVVRHAPSHPLPADPKLVYTVHTHTHTHTPTQATRRHAGILRHAHRPVLPRGIGGREYNVGAYTSGIERQWIALI